VTSPLPDTREFRIVEIRILGQFLGRPTRPHRHRD